MTSDNNIYFPLNPRESLLEAALRYDHLGYRVIPTTASKAPACGEGWNKPDWRQDEETLKNVFLKDRAAGIAVVLYPITDLISIDFDGPHSTTLWQSPVKLDDVCRHSTPHGGHILFKVSEKFREVAKSFERKVRLIKAGEGCQCAKGKCGIDLLLNGYVIVPPTPGYVDKVAIENVTELPDKILDSMLQRLQEKKAEPSNQNEKFDIDAALAGVEDGQRGETLFRYASSLRARGVVQSEALILVRNAADNCHPPYKEKLIEKLVDDVYRRYSGPAEDINLEDFGIESFTDHGNAMRIVKKYGDIIHWTKGFGWMVYDKHWILHETATSNVYQFATSALLDIKKEVTLLPVTLDQDKAKSIKKEILNYAKKSESTALREQALAQVKHQATIAISENAFDTNPWLLNVSNGTLNLKTFEFYSHRREDLLTKMANVEYDEDAQCPQWDEFIALIMDGNEKLTRFLQKAIGYSLTGSVQEKCFFICYGASGENGKSTFVNAINDMLGKYAKPTRIQTFLEKNNESSNDIAALAGARFVSSIEVKETRRFDEALVKQLTGGDPVTARFLFKEFFEYYPQFKIWLAVNNKPQFDATDSALVNRLRVIPFNVNIAEKIGFKNLDRNFGTKLRAEFPGILNWALEGLRLWQEEGLGTCEEVVAAVQEYKLENDNVTSFLEDNCIKGPYSISKTDLYSAYVSACNQTKTQHVSKNTFGNQVMKFGVKEGRTSKARLWEGITTKDHLSRVEKEMAAAEENFNLLQESVSEKRELKH